tara:strand:+ start:5091 stop:5423 length:333 start_codon:yes stop_codon:yes gene_type:complete
VTNEYAIRVSTILNAADIIVSDLDYLCALIEKPDPEFVVKDAIAYSAAIAALSTQLEFILEDLADNDLTKDEEHIKITEEEVWALNSYTESTEDALKRLEDACGISLQSN